MSTNTFVPLAAPSAVATSPTGVTQTKAPGEASSAKVFRPLHDAVAASPSAAHIPGEPKITFERDGDRVTRIRIQCSCGHTLELDCAY